MKTNNLIALVLGIICAGLLWQYYLYPKYNKKVEDPKVMSALLQADKQALDAELATIPGELLYRTDTLEHSKEPQTTIIYEEESAQKLEEESNQEPEESENQISFIKAPVKYRIVNKFSQYQKVKDNLAYTGKVDFSKEMLILLESDSNLSDGFFQIKNIENNGKEIIVSYSFNIIGANDRESKISAQKTPKSDLPIILQQVF